MLFASISLLIAFNVVAPSYSVESLQYEPSIVILSGTVSLQEFPGPPNYEDIKNGDRLEQHWILTLKRPVRVSSLSNDELFFAQENVTEIQLVCFEKCSEKFLFSLGEEVTLKGTLFSAHSGHHHKSVLMTVKKRI